MAEIIDLGGGTPVTATTSATKRKAATNTSLPISDILFLTLRRWPWIILSVLICTGAALYYVLKTPTVYTRAAQLMIKDSSSGKSANISDIADFGIVPNKTDVEDEIINLRSGELMGEVVRRLNLDIDYYRDGRFHNVVAYGENLPVNIHFIDMAPELSAYMELNLSDGKYSISDITFDGERLKETVNGAINDTINTPLGRITVVPTGYYKPGGEISLKVYKLPMSYTRASYSSRLSVSQVGEKSSSLIRLTMSDRSAQRADAVLGTLIDVYKDAWIRDKNEIAIYTSQFINDRLGVIESELGNVDQDISSFKSENLITDPTAISSMYMSQNQQVSSEIVELNNQIQLAKLIRSTLTTEYNGNKLLPSNSGIVGDVVSQINAYNELVLQRNSLIDKSSETNPLVVSIDGQLASLRSAIITTIDNQITALTTRLGSLQSALANTTSKIASSPSQAKYLLSVERQQKVKEALYLFLLQKREENELSQAFTAYNTRVINAPGPSGVPPSPNKTSILAISFAIGLALPFAVTFLIETANTRIRGRKDIEHLSIPFLGEVPLDAETSNRKAVKEEKEVNTILVKEGKRDIINEAFRVLRTNVEFIHVASEGANIIAVTSFNPGSGKSFITVNLGMTMALKNKRVLVIDGDMRHGSTSRYIGSPDKGLSNYLSATDTRLNTLIVKEQSCKNLDILPIGPVPPNPTELLESERFGEMLKELRTRYDYILIDCPPIEIVADAQIIDNHADRTIFVIRAGLLERSMLPELERIYDEKKYRNMALILNGTALSTSRYGYSHGYRYGYGYGYSYGYNYSSKSEK